MGFCHLHAHSMYSLYDGLGTNEDRAARAKELGQSALALTDHGTMAGLVTHYYACKVNGIHPVLGVEGYFEWEFQATPKAKRHHMTILCETLEGYQNLNRMLTIAAQESFYRYPIITWGLLSKYHEGLIILSGCLAGYVPQALLRNDQEEADRAFRAFHDLLGDRFYAEVMPFEDKENQQKKVNLGILELASKHNVEVVLTNDAHYISPEERNTHSLKFAINGGEPEADYEHLYLCDEKEAIDAWHSLMIGTPYRKCRQYINNSGLIAERCNVDLSFAEAIPTLQWDKPSRHKLADLCKEGLKAKGKYSGEENKKYRERIKYEFDVIDQKGYVDYFLLCYDIYEFARQNGIKYGLGRGSVCGSLLAYAIGLTNVDPLMFGTHFERFLRPNKITIPDIDSDFESSRRGDIVDYIMRRYEGHAAAISTFGYYKVKNLINDLSKCLNVSSSDSTKLKELLAEKLTDDDAGKVESHEELYEFLTSDTALQLLDRRNKQILLHFSRLFGQVRYIGKHAAGIAITDGPIEQYCSLIKTKDGLQTCYDLNDLGHLNVVKIDILGLNTLDVIHEAERLIGQSYDIYSILEDTDTWEAFQSGQTKGVFQFDSSLGVKVVKKVKPASLLELAACSGLNRPGPLKLGVVDKFLAGKKGKLEVSGLLYQFLQDAYGVVLYQEHMMQIAVWCGLSWAETDKLIKGISKKTAGKDPIREKFIAGCIAQGMEEGEATNLYDSGTQYLFNKGHAIGYSLVSFYTMYLKIHHPHEYWTALLKCEQDDAKRLSYEEAAVTDGIGILIPSINGSASYSMLYDSEGDPWIEQGLSSLPGVGEKAAQEIAEKAPYTDKFDLVRRVNSRILTKPVFDALEKAGALEFEFNKQMELSAVYCQSLKSKLADLHQKDVAQFAKRRKAAKK